MIEVQYQTGCTVSELVAIRKKDVQQGSIVVGGRHCIVSEELTRNLKDYFRSHDSAYAFPSRQTPQMVPKRVQQIVKKYLLRVDGTLEHATPQILRYTHIAHALEQHVPLPAIRAQTGLGELRLAQIADDVTQGTQDAYRRMLR